MKFFVDTADTQAISELNDLGMVDGVTTNPSLILKSGRDIIEVTREICGRPDLKAAATASRYTSVLPDPVTPRNSVVPYCSEATAVASWLAAAA